MIKLADIYQEGNLESPIPVEKPPPVKRPPAQQTDETQLREKERELRDREQQLAQLTRNAEQRQKDLEEKEKAAEKKLEEKEKGFRNYLKQQEEKGQRKKEVKSPEKEGVSVPSEDDLPRVSEVSTLIYKRGLELVKEVIKKVGRGVPFDFQELSRYAETLLDQINLDDSKLLRFTLRASSRGACRKPFLYKAVNSAVLAAEVGIGLQYETDLLQDLILTALLHDVGLSRVKDLIDSPKELDPEKKQEVMKHPLYPVELLKQMGVSERIISAIAQHHERLDGKGYPHGLQDREISKLARVLQVVDSFEAAMHARPYRKGKSYADVMKEMCELSGEIYDSSVVKALVNRIGLYGLDVLVELTTGQIGRVIAQNPNCSMRPVVRLEFNAKGNRLEENEILDLREQPSVHIVGVVQDIESFSKISKEIKKESQRKLSSLDFLITAGGVVVILALIIFLLKL